MEEKTSPIKGRYWTLEDMNTECVSIVEAAHVCMKETTLSTPRSSRIYACEWWTKKIAQLQARLKTIRRYLRKWTYKRLWRDLPDTSANRMKYTFDDLKKARRAFKKACRKAKRKHWQKMVADIRSAVATANFAKRLNKAHNAEIGLFTKPDGQRCNVEETMDLLKDTHFPGNTTTQPPPTKPLATVVDIKSKKAAFITPDRVKTIIQSFKPRKGAGPDGLKPAVFQAFGPSALQRLTNLFKASYLLGVQPDHFKQVRIIFIPKPERITRWLRPIGPYH